VPGWWSGAALPVGFVRIIRIFRIRTSRARVPQEAGGTQASIHHQSLRRRAARKWRALALHSPAAGIAYPGVHRRAGGHSGAMGNARHCDLSARVARYSIGAALPVGFIRIIRFFCAHEWKKASHCEPSGFTHQRVGAVKISSVCPVVDRALSTLLFPQNDKNFSN